MSVNATATSSAVVVSDISAGCQNLPMTVRTTSNLASAQVTLTQNVQSPQTSLALTGVDPTQITGVLVAIDGWNMSVNWSAPAGGGPIVVDPNTPTISFSVAWNQMAATQFCADINVTSSSTTLVPWALNMNLNQPPFNSVTTSSGFYLSQGAGLYSTSVTNGQLKIQGSTTSTQKVSNKVSQSFTVCNWDVPPPLISSDPKVHYSITQTTPSPSWWVCKDVTVSVTGTDFYVGWEANVDISDLKAAYVGSNGAVKGPSGDFTKTQTGATTYKVKGTGWNTWGVRPDHSVTFSMCYG